MTLKEDKDLVRITLSSSKHATDVTNQPCFSKVSLDAKISCSINHYLRLSISTLLICLLIGLEIRFLTAREEFAASPQNIFDLILNISPLILLAWPLILLLLDKPLSQFDLYLVEPGVDMAHIPMSNKKNNRVCVATRILCPQLEPTAQQRKNPKLIFDWLNSWLLQGLKINILRVALEQHFADTAYINKLLISLQLHRVQLLSYLLLLFGTAFWAYCSDYEMKHNEKYILRTLGLLWWWLAFYLYRKQIRNLNRWMEKTRRQFFSTNLPLFVWDAQQRYWQELTRDEIKKPFVKEYGLESEKIIALTQSFLLVLHQTYLGFL
jgi:hypothetical protein